MSYFLQYLNSSIGKKQIVALSGLALILFVLAHLAGNLFLYFGPDAYNGYAKKLESLGPLLYVMRIGLIATFLVHIGLTIKVVLENRGARRHSYAEFKPVGARSLATRTMALSGSVIFAFIVFHLRDFTFSAHHGPMSLVNGEDLGLYGLVTNAFRDPVHALLYILAVVAVGSHVSHAFESAFQSFGLNHPIMTPCLIRASRFLGVVVTIAYASIPIYVFLFLK